MGVDAEDVRYFHVLAQAGTLVRAAKELGVDHTTVSRRVRRLEAALDLRLFTRTRSGWTISPNGERLLPAARMVALGSDAFTTGDSAQTGPEEWTILSPDGFAASVLTPACVRPLGDDTVITIISAPSLAAREGTAFDAAIVRSRPNSSAVASRALADYEIGLYAHEDYLSEHGRFAASTTSKGTCWHGTPMIRSPESPNSRRCGPNCPNTSDCSRTTSTSTPRRPCPESAWPSCPLTQRPATTPWSASCPTRSATAATTGFSCRRPSCAGRPHNGSSTSSPRQSPPPVWPRRQPEIRRRPETGRIRPKMGSCPTCAPHCRPRSDVCACASSD